VMGLGLFGIVLSAVFNYGVCKCTSTRAVYEGVLCLTVGVVEADTRGSLLFGCGAVVDDVVFGGVSTVSAFSRSCVRGEGKGSLLTVSQDRRRRRDCCRHVLHLSRRCCALG
jgi:hypothetical protein